MKYCLSRGKNVLSKKLDYNVKRIISDGTQKRLRWKNATIGFKREYLNTLLFICDDLNVSIKILSTAGLSVQELRQLLLSVKL